jgi:flagellin-like hook-associated protein FlgL
MSRIGSYGASQMYLSRLTAIQSRLTKTQVQVSTELKSTAYSGVAADSNRIINLENEVNRANSFVRDNTLAETKLKAATVSMDAIDTTLKNFQKRLNEYASGSPQARDKVEQVQKWAYDAMVDLQSYLAANVDGQYIFSGGRLSDEPVKLPTDNQADFQKLFDGTSVTYPTSRAASLFDLHTDSTQTGNISFDGATGTINAPSLTSSPNALSNIPAGARIKVSDSGGGANDGKTFTVRGVTVDGTGTHLDVSPLTDEGGPVPGTISYTDANGAKQTVSSNLTFNPGADTIQIAASSGLTVGQVFSISGTPNNNAVYEVQSIITGPPDTVTIKGTKVTTQAASANIKLDSDSWYQGDTIQLQHRVDADRSVDLGIYASEPAFEKAFRALGLIAQGAYGTAGGLENHPERVAQAKFLIQDAIERTGNGQGPSPLGQEQTGDLHSLQAQIGVTQGVIAAKNTKHKEFANFLVTRVTDLERVDKTEAVARLLDDQTALQTSYQALATVRGLSLLNYMK